jgi:hypothetical protein
MCVSMLKLPFTSVLLATVLLASDSYAVMPLAIVAVVVGYVATQWIPSPRGWLDLSTSQVDLVSPEPAR